MLDLSLPPLWRDGFTLFLSLVVQALPFLLLGVFVSGVLAVFVNEQKLMRWLPQGRWSSSLLGGSLGFFFPVCECGNLPVARRLVMKGIPPHFAIAFLLAAPVFNPVVIAATWIAFRATPEMVVYRVGLSFAIAVVVGWIFSFQKDLEPLLHPDVWQERQRTQQTQSSNETRNLLAGGTFLIPSTSSLSGSFSAQSTTTTLQTAEEVYRTALDQGDPWQAGQQFGGGWAAWRLLLDTWSREIQELGSVLVVGAAVAALIQTVLPRAFLLNYGQGPIVSVVVMLGLAVVVSICSTVDAFFALAFAATFTPGSLLAFMVFGPMIDLKAVGLLLTLFRPRTVFYLIVLTLQFTLIGALALNFYG
ncbi:MAG: permease [Cyanobacteriota bacterium]|nr:permease [Cyanobacteriota bacterium]